MQAPKKSAMQGTGSNFVNLQSFLSPAAAQQNQQRVQSLGSELQTNERDTFNKAADPLRKASFSTLAGSARDLVDRIVPQEAPKPTGDAFGKNAAATNNPAAHIQGSFVDNSARTWVPMPGFAGQFREYDPKRDGKTGGGSMPDPEDTKPPAPTQQQADATAKAGNLSQLQAMLTQDYTGPMSVDYNPSAGMQRLDQLGSADTALNALSPGSFTENLPKNMGTNWLDRSMIQSDAGTMSEIGKVKSAADAFRKESGDESAALAAKAKGFKDAAAAARDKTRGDLESYGKEILGGIDKRVKDAQAKELADQQGKVLRDPTTGDVVGPGYGQRMTDNWEAGTGASRGNISTGTERGRLSELSKLLGMPDYSVAPAGEYKSGRYTTEQIPGAMTSRGVSEDEALVKSGVASNNTQKAKYDELRAKGYPVNEAIKLAKADNNLTVRSVKG